jgi:hypothetical protein
VSAKPVECVAAEEIGDILALPEDDPRRAHLETCPRCRALVVSHREFLAAHDDESAYGEPESRRLDAARERLLAEPRPASAHRRSAAPVGGAWWDRWFAPALRPAWAIALVVIAAGVVLYAARPRTPGSEPVLRGGGSEPMRLSEPELRPDGGVVLRWRSEAGAERYEVHFYSTSLVEVGQRVAGADTSVTLAPADLPEVYRAGGVLLYRVRAMRGGDAIATSVTGALRRR